MNSFSEHFLHLYMYAARSSKNSIKRPQTLSSLKRSGIGLPHTLPAPTPPTSPQTTRLMTMSISVFSPAALLVEPRVSEVLPH